MNGRKVAVLKASAKEKPGQKYKVDLTGTLYFDLDKGCLYKSVLEGTIKKRVLVMLISVPVKFWLDTIE